jgi:hypothetical protein
MSRPGYLVDMHTNTSTLLTQPVPNGTRIIVNGNFQPYAEAYVVDCVMSEGGRCQIVLEWPKAPGGPSYSRVNLYDEGRRWERYVNPSDRN